MASGDRAHRPWLRSAAGAAPSPIGLAWEVCRLGDWRLDGAVAASDAWPSVQSGACANLAGHGELEAA